MTADHGARKETLRDRIFLFGIRQLILVVAIVIAGLYVLLSGLIYSAVENIVGGLVIVLIGGGLAYGFKTTAVRRVTKRYYTVDTIIGKQGIAKVSFDEGAKGVVNVDNEYWSAVTADRIAEGDPVTVVSVEADKVTLRVKRA